MKECTFHYLVGSQFGNMVLMYGPTRRVQLEQLIMLIASRIAFMVATRIM